MSRTLTVFCFLMLLVCTAALGHAPKEVNAKFDDENKVLSVTVVHEVKDAAKHFVNSVSIELNGKEIIRQDFLAQENLEQQEALYRITDAGVGDEIEVSAECNISGKKKATVKIEKKAEKEAEEEEKGGEAEEARTE